MTSDDVLDVLSVVRMMWPHGDLGQARQTAAVWLDTLGAFDRAEVEAAVRRLGDREFPPTAAIVAGEIQRTLQAAPPGFDELAAAFTAALPTPVFLRELYDPDGMYSAESTARAIALLQAGGGHEALLRHVQERGLRAFLVTPDGSRYGLDPNQLADRRDAARHYRDSTLPGWRRHPEPGLALERACQTAGLDAYQLLELAAGAHEQQQLRAAQRPALPAGPPDESVPIDVDPAEALRVYREQLAEARKRRAGDLTARRRAEREAQRAALGELAGHAVRGREGATR
jgi:hypothetical protein